MEVISPYLLSAIALIACFFLSSLYYSLRSIPYEEFDAVLQSIRPLRFLSNFYNIEDQRLKIQSILFSNFHALALCQFLFLFFALYLFFQAPNFTLLHLLKALFLFIAFFFITDFIPKALATTHPKNTLRTSAPISAGILVLLLPISHLLLRFTQNFFSASSFDHLFNPNAHVPKEIMEMLRQDQHESDLEGQEKLMIEALAGYRKRIVREVMIPRVNVFGLPAETTQLEAAKAMFVEGYSRAPVYHETIDNVIGVLMYKDLLEKFMQCVETRDFEQLNRPIEEVIKGVLYTPETKKISGLLQEFRSKQVHIAIVVDEYGGTEGIVTIEDILEEIVGDISDEYDEDDAELFVQQPDGSYIIDGRMPIHEVEEKLHIEIPQASDYDTVAGFIFHTAGAIPKKGFVIHTEKFQIEVLSSNDRIVEKVCIREPESSGADEN